MKLLVTGGLGYIGSVVTHRLLDAGHEVEILDDLSTGHLDVLPDGVRLHQHDIHDVDQVLTRHAGFDGVLHLAGLISAGESVHHPDRYWDVNVTGSLRLLAAMRDASVPRLIFSSTGSMYAPKGMDTLTETDPIAPPGPYATTKYVTDLAITDHARAFGIAAASLRYFNAAGAAGRLGERHDPETHLIPLALHAAATGGTTRIFGEDYPTPDGTCVRDYIHVEDLATAHLLALQAVQPGRHEIYNLGNGNGYSTKEVLATVEQVTGTTLTIQVDPPRPGDAVVVVASADKAARELGWQPQHPDLTRIIGDAWAFHQHNTLSHPAIQ
ncbi:UDP-glucose 4-epimerase GalE [Streptoalloteichus hindustanus]|uniref:UDP-glucose 4-epimerase n=1 Tax=Streptoalloteichus hindustanus TaxID=2017 RepID=A0A1M5MKJ2_STRHI|nr:UDP-glucose 4-epimerase GalE [Streptoalloteichus hindustanus]SHG77283.1 UDP-galactose 4-epimerase [Streptoalloteichus hindustanus]